MNLKEFDAKRFLLEKGERVGLGIAVTVMVLMLVFSLFMPSHGFFSGSPSANAKPLEEGATKLKAALSNRNNKPGPADSPPEKAERQLIALDTTRLDLQLYEMGAWYQPTAPINPARRPPLIQNITEALIQVVHIPIDTYIFTNNYSKITVLRDPDNKGGTAGGAGAPPMALNMMKGMGAMAGQGGKQPPGMSIPNLSGNRVQGADEKHEYDAVAVPLNKVTSGDRLAHLPRPVRMAIIAASFPYKKQLEEFKTKLRLNSIEEVLSETVEDPKGSKESKEKPLAFRFLGVEVQRKEFDVNGKALGDWKTLDLKDSYAPYLLNSGLPFEEDDPKYAPIKNYGLVWPRLREFREDRQDQSAMSPAAPFVPGVDAAKEAPRREGDSKYPDLAGKLPSIQKTLAALADVEPKKIAVPNAKFQKNFDYFNPQNPPPTGEPSAKEEDRKEPGTIYPEHCLVQLIDVTVDPGRFYRYRVKIKMANPNYNNPDVASPEYKRNPELVSKDWFELPQTVSVPPELIYYAVDQKHISTPKNEEGSKTAVKPVKGTLRAAMWATGHEPLSDRQVTFQFHRWIDSTPIVPDGEPVPIGEWSVADRVFVARGEYVGQKVKVDLPVWKYTLDSYVLPVEDQKARKVRTREGLKVPTGVTVNFGQDNPDRETILVDFEGGRDSIKALKIDDVSGIEVLMLSPDGKLRARNSVVDTNDKERENRRTHVLDRIEDIRQGKTSGGTNAGGGLDAPRRP